MDLNTLKLLSVLSSYLTPLVILLLGVSINRNLERTKHGLAQEMERTRHALAEELEKSRVSLEKEKGWRFAWAERLLSVCGEYSDSVTQVVTGLGRVIQLQDEKKSEAANERFAAAMDSAERLQYLQWELQNLTQFAAANGEAVVVAANEIYALLAQGFDDRCVKAEEIRKAQFRFNDAVRTAHAEILGVEHA